MKKMSITSKLLIGLASLSMATAFFLPTWFIFLVAPQYPEGLEMNIWLTKITGQVDIINGVNHYIGMKRISAEMFPEFNYMVYILGGFIVYGLMVAVTGSRKLLLSLLLLSIVTAGAALYDFYRWGYEYGHNLDPKAAIKVPGMSYEPPVIGHKTLLNFDAYSYPDVGGWVILGAGFTFFLVYFLEWRRLSKATKQNISISSMQVAAAAHLVFFLSSCSSAPEPFVYGKDVCDDCRMTIMDPHFGAELITKKGRVFKFDDALCVANYFKTKKPGTNEIRQTLFIDYNTENKLLDASETFFVVSPQLKSPMNSHSAAFSTKEEASKKAAATAGTVKTWEILAKELQQ